MITAKKEVIGITAQALTFCMKRGFRTSLFVDPPEDDADMLLETALKGKVPPSSKPDVVTGVKAWRHMFGHLAFMPDELPKEL